MRIRLSDDSSLIVHAEIFAAGGISTGSRLDEAAREDLRARSELAFARQSALGIISRGPQTRRGLRDKLRKRGFSEDAARAAIARMTELGYLDDRLFAEGWTRARLSAKKEGWNALSRGLRARGVPRKLAEDVVSEICTTDVEMEKARLLAGRLPAPAAARALASRGFRARTIARVLREIRDPGRGEGEG